MTTLSGQEGKDEPLKEKKHKKFGREEGQMNKNRW